MLPYGLSAAASVASKRACQQAKNNGKGEEQRHPKQEHSRCGSLCSVFRISVYLRFRTEQNHLKKRLQFKRKALFIQMKNVRIELAVQQLTLTTTDTKPRTDNGYLHRVHQAKLPPLR